MNQKSPLSTFLNYARYYDLLYRDKNYSEEVVYLVDLMKSLSRSSGSILDLGCGTGVHAQMLAEHGFEVHGIDRSQEMLTMADSRKVQSAKHVSDRLSFQQADIREFDLKRKFDVVFALFHVMSYQTENADLEQVFQNVRKHLGSGGYFVFDCWYGPTVLALRPEERKKIWENEALKIVRHCRPELHVNKNVVDVHYDIDVFDKITNEQTKLNELHRMRYFFKPELEYMFSTQGFRLLKAEEWLTTRELGVDTWGGCFVCQFNG